jgi:hypothetical protein
VFGSHEKPIFIHPDLSYLHKRKWIIDTSYHHYSHAPSRGLRADKEGTCDASESEAMRTHVQRASALSSVKSALRPDPSISSSVFSSRKCDTVATNTEQDIDSAREDGPLASPSTKSRTHVAKIWIASSSAYASRRAASSTLSCPVASSR